LPKFIYEKAKINSISMHSIKKTNNAEVMTFASGIYLMIYVIERSLQLLINNEVIEVNAHEVFLYKSAGGKIQIMGPESKYYILQMLDGELEEILKKVPCGRGETKYTIIGFESEKELIITICEQLICETKSSQYHNRMISSLSECLLAIMNRAANEAAQHENAFIDRVMRYIQEHFSEDISLVEIANNMHVSASHLSHVFKESTGLSPIKYVINCRMEYAKKLLLTTDNTIMQIAMKCGYDNSNYFSLLFKKMVGYSPAHFRRKEKKHKPPTNGL